MKTNKVLLLTAVIIFCNSLSASASSDPDCEPFITTWQTDNVITGSSCASCITIPTKGPGYSYDVDWDNNGIYDAIGMTGSVVHDFGAPGRYTIRIRGEFPRISFAFHKDVGKIVSVDQWGDIAWETMTFSFRGCKNLTIPASDSPDLSGVTDISGMFFDADAFNQDISHWDVSTVTNMSALFRTADTFNQDLSNWDVSSVENMSVMFYDAAAFNSPLAWGAKTAAVTNMSSMFYNTLAFDQDLSAWDVSAVENMSRMFYLAEAFDSPLNWEAGTANVTTMSQMFASTKSFNQNLSSWDVSSVTDMSDMFNSADRFNSPLGWGGNVSNVTDMSGMFASTDVFNQDISAWDVSSVTTMSFMFEDAAVYNKPIIWNNKTAAVVDMSYIFSGADAFNQDLSNWNFSEVTDMARMFFDADAFDQDLGDWNIGSVMNMTEMLDFCGLSIDNYDQTLIGWAAQSLQTGVTCGAQDLYYCQGVSAHDNLENIHGWTIVDDEEDGGENKWTHVVAKNWNEDPTLWWLNRFPSRCSDLLLTNNSIIALKDDEQGYGGTLEVVSGASLDIEGGAILEIAGAQN